MPVVALRNGRNSSAEEQSAEHSGEAEKQSSGDITPNSTREERDEKPLSGDPEAQPERRSDSVEEDVFGNEEGAEIQYKTCEWWCVDPEPCHLHHR